MTYKDMSFYREGRMESKVVRTWLQEYKQMVMNEIIYRQSNPTAVSSDTLSAIYNGSPQTAEIVADTIVGWLNSPVGREFVSQAFNVDIPKSAEDGTEYTKKKKIFTRRQNMKRHKEQGVYRLKKAISELHCLDSSIKEIEDDMDKELVLSEIDEIRWLVNEGLQDLLEGE